MKPYFHHKAVNGPFEDPCVYVRFLRDKRAILFDLGDVRRLSQNDLNKLSDIFITHMHIDHFIGFDIVLRSLLRREKPLSIYGPQGIIDCVKGRLMGYSWNLIEDYPLVLDVYEIKNKQIHRARFSAREHFKAESLQVKDFKGVLLHEDAVTISAVPLTHGIPTLAYCIEEDFHINIDKVRLLALGLDVGPWLAELKKAIGAEASDEVELDVNGKKIMLKELRQIAHITDGQKVAYVADTSPTEENMEIISSFVHDATTLYCETYFMDEHEERAKQRNHLTGGAVGRMALGAKVKELVPIHFSPIYRKTELTPGDEALQGFLRNMKKEVSQ
jgi:ribonuclease Z